MDDAPAGHASGGDGAFGSNLLDGSHGLSAQVQGNLVRVYQMLDGVDKTDSEFECTVREDVIEHDFFQRGDIEALNAAVCAAGSRYPGSTQLLIASFVVFEWYHRCDIDVRKRLVAWQRLPRFASKSRLPVSGAAERGGGSAWMRLFSSSKPRSARPRSS